MNPRRNWFAIVCLLSGVFASLPGQLSTGTAKAEPMSLTAYVDPFIGTSGAGHTYPAAQAPYGMIQIGPDTPHRKGGAGYDFNDTHIQSFSLTHLNGVGCDAASDLPFIPAAGPLSVSPVHNRTAYQQPKAGEQASPGYYRTDLAGTGIGVELAATERVGMAHFRFPAAQEGSILFVPPNATKPVYDSRLSIDPDGRTIGGWVRSGGFCNGTNRYTIYFHAEFDAPFRAFGTWDGDIRSDGSRTAGGDDGALYISFDTNVNRTVRMKTAISFVSEENARTNLETEMSGWDIGKVREWTDASWNRILSRIRVSGGTEEQFKTFYTALYRVFLQPSLFNDVNGQYIGFDDIVRKIPDGRNVYSTFSLWDTYRTQPQLLAMLAPDAASDMVNSLLLASHQTTEGGGGLPGWSYYNDDPNVMATYPAPLFIANADAFGARDYDREAMLDKMIEVATSTDSLKKASSADTDGAVWWGLEHYMTKGYIESVSATLEYAKTDFAIGMYSKAMGDDKRYRYFRNRSQHAFRLFDADASESGGYFRRKDAEGNWEAPFSPTASEGFMEGNSAQYSWMTPHNIGELIRRMGGPEPFAARLGEHLSRFEKDGWPVHSPYWWSGNEPGMGVPFLFNWAGRPWLTQQKVREIVATQWNGSSNGLPGNDDTGALSAWYIWAALGLYPEIPGVSGLTVFSPLFPHAEIDLGNGTTVTIRADRTGSSNTYIRSMKVNGVARTATWITMEELKAGKGAGLEFVLGDDPGGWGTGADDAPPSFGEIGRDQYTNVALNRPAFSDSGSCRSDEAAAYATDGNPWTKWCGPSNGGHVLGIDLGDEYVIGRWRVLHAGVAEWPKYNTKSFRLQVSADGEKWSEADAVKGNTADVTERTFPETRARYVRLSVQEPTQDSDSAARIYEFELYGKPGEE